MSQSLSFLNNCIWDLPFTSYFMNSFRITSLIRLQSAAVCVIAVMPHRHSLDFFVHNIQTLQMYIIKIKEHILKMLPFNNEFYNNTKALII